jgi:hypothetical protein
MLNILLVLQLFILCLSHLNHKIHKHSYHLSLAQLTNSMRKDPLAG